MPNAVADSWGILLIQCALNRGIPTRTHNEGHHGADQEGRARAGKEDGLTYAGALLPAEAHRLMQEGAALVDVRTKPELLYVGRVPGGSP